MRCTAPVEGHRTASGAANCPACRGRSSRSYYSYTPPVQSFRPPAARPSVSSGGTSSRRTSSGGTVTYTSSERRTLAPIHQQFMRQVEKFPDRRDLFLCHAWDDRAGAAKELHDELQKIGVSVWFSEKDVALGTSLIREIDKGLGMSKIGIVLVTPSMFKSLSSAGVADKELSALLATDRVIPVVHGTSFDELRDYSPLLAARSGLSTDGSSLEEVAVKIADTVDTDTLMAANAGGGVTSRDW
ncbi:toll/interleukin-1 receptor domain-containing protein (plasmid) [Microbacterium sp. NIBRBAC000506063]|nr:toll/interleukin-1 receptor domain-containing protein [Microbacterium sp. NIBRBAC000506063]QTV81002.1 toll/interleukin-1 receptor domain-containing protein [Microbacterium sp. NIBRBAC000506063]